MAEYEALLHGMRAAKEMNVNRLRCYGDSDLVAGQVIGTCDAVSPTMAAYRQVVDRLGGHFACYSIEWIDGRKMKRPTHSLASARPNSHHPPESSSTPSPSPPSHPQGRSTSESRCSQRQPWSH